MIPRTWLTVLSCCRTWDESSAFLVHRWCSIVYTTRYRGMVHRWCSVVYATRCRAMVHRLCSVQRSPAVQTWTRLTVNPNDCYIDCWPGWLLYWLLTRMTVILTVDPIDCYIDYWPDRLLIYKTLIICYILHRCLILSSHSLQYFALVSVCACLSVSLNKEWPWIKHIN